MCLRSGWATPSHRAGIGRQDPSDSHARRIGKSLVSMPTSQTRSTHTRKSAIEQELIYDNKALTYAFGSTSARLIG